MKNALKKVLLKQLSKIIAIERLTPKENILSLIEKLHPYHVDKELIRIGPQRDGGYLVPDDLTGIQACFSPGVDKVSEFELWCLNNGMEIYLADKSVDKVNIDISPDKYNFIKKYIGCTNNSDFITLDQWVNSNISTDTSELLLQMDIEGGEYDSLISASDTLMKRFRILVIEFHFLHRLWTPSFFHFAEIVFNKILQTHSCVHIHPNNLNGVDSRIGVEIPRVAEFTFLRNDRITHKKHETQFPHKLDYDNTNNEHIILPKNWYKSS